MTKKIKTPYDDTPYEVLSDPELGPLPIDASRDEVSDRVKKLMKIKPRAAVEARKKLMDPGKRIGWDIFCSPLEQEQQAIQELVEQPPSLSHITPAEPEVAISPEFLVWDGNSPTGDSNDITCQELSLSLSTQYDAIKNPFREVTFDI